MEAHGPCVWSDGICGAGGGLGLIEAGLGCDSSEGAEYDGCGFGDGGGRCVCCGKWVVVGLRKRSRAGYKLGFSQVGFMQLRWRAESCMSSGTCIPVKKAVSKVEDG